jgi:predicted TIM-barrel fold metal-dependent hydrolase
MLETGKTWVKLSAPMRSTDEEFPYSRMTAFARMLVKHAPERLLWGSDWPHVQLNDRLMPNDGDLVDLLAEWIPDTALRQRVFARNPLALYE